MPRCRRNRRGAERQPRENTTGSWRDRSGSSCILPAVADTRVLLLGNASSDAVARVLSQHGRFLTRVEDPDDAIRVAADHQIIVIDAVPPPRPIASVCRAVRAVEQLAEQPIPAISPPDTGQDRTR